MYTVKFRIKKLPSLAIITTTMTRKSTNFSSSAAAANKHRYNDDDNANVQDELSADWWICMCSHCVSRDFVQQLELIVSFCPAIRMGFR